LEIILKISLILKRISRSAHSFNNHLLLATSYRPLQRVACHLGSGQHVRILKMFVQFSSRQLFTFTHHLFTRRTTISTSRINHRGLNIHSTQTQPLMCFDTFWKAIMSYPGSQWIQILMIGSRACQFTFKCSCSCIICTLR
jgi:hypothetical protein